MISKNYVGPGGGNANSDAPNISPDDRYLAYQSLASNLVPGDTNVVEGVDLYDSLSGTNTLVSLRRAGLSRNHAVETQVVAPWIFAQGEE
jgi:hypothetical protein